MLSQDRAFGNDVNVGPKVPLLGEQLFLLFRYTTYYESKI